MLSIENQETIEFPDTLMQWSKRVRHSSRMAALSERAAQEYAAAAPRPGDPVIATPSETGLARARKFHPRLGLALHAVADALISERIETFDHILPADLPGFRRERMQHTLESFVASYLRRLGLAGRYIPSVLIRDDMAPHTPAAISLPFGNNSSCVFHFSDRFVNACDIHELLAATAHELAHLILFDLSRKIEHAVWSDFSSDDLEILTDLVGILAGLGGVCAIEKYRNHTCRYPAAGNAPDRIVARYSIMGYASAAAVGYAIGLREKLGLDNESPENVLTRCGAHQPEYWLFMAGVTRARKEWCC